MKAHVGFKFLFVLKFKCKKFSFKKNFKGTQGTFRRGKVLVKEFDLGTIARKKTKEFE